MYVLDDNDNKIELGDNPFSDEARDIISRTFNTPKPGVCECSRGGQCTYPHEFYRPAIYTADNHPKLMLWIEGDCAAVRGGWECAIFCDNGEVARPHHLTTKNNV